LEKKYIDDVSLFSALGFDTVHSADYSDFEGADIVLDLNKPVPSKMHDRYDTIIDGSTIEHIFHLPNVQNNIHNMLKVGGRIIHFTPSASFFRVDHGFYMFSPTLLNEYYQSNRHRIEKVYISVFKWGESETGVRDIYQYDPKKPHLLHHLRRDSIEIFLVATEAKDSTGDAIPQQGSYLRGWSKNTGCRVGSIVVPEMQT